MTLNIPETRQARLARRLGRGEAVGAAEAAREFGVSVDTIRRDIIALEGAGQARRVRGGAVPVKPPDAAMAAKVAARMAPADGLVRAALARIGGARTLMLHGGSTVLALARALEALPGRVVMTPSPWVAVACAERGIEVYLLGGTLSAAGGVASGLATEAALGALAAEVAVLGACGLEAGFGLSADAPDEARSMQAMAAAADMVMVLAPAAKLGQRARHRVLGPEEIDVVVTDGDAADLAARGVEVCSGNGA